MERSETIDANRLVLELHVPDFKEVKEFYGKLGFKVASEQPIGENLGYLVMQRDRTFINFYGGDDRVYGHSFFKDIPRSTHRGYEVEITVVVDDVETYYNSIQDGIRDSVVQPLVTKRWGIKDFRLRDPFGFYVRFTDPVAWLD